MKVDSLEELGAAFAEWRRKKKHRREATPKELLDRARRAVVVHGEGCVADALKVDRERLRGARRRSSGSRGARLTKAPLYSRMELVVPEGDGGRLFAEMELPNGAKVRLYSQTRQTLGLLSAMCRAGSSR